MKISFFISGPDHGGGYHQIQGLFSIIQKIENSNDVFIFITDQEKIKNFIKKKGFECVFYKSFFFQRLYNFIFNLFNKLNIFIFKSHFYYFIKKRKIDLIFFISPSIFVNYSRGLNYVVSFWNTEIKKYKYFPEFKNGGYEYQKKIIINAVKYAYKIFVTTKKSKTDMKTNFLCHPKKIYIQNLHPYLPSLYKKNKKKNYKKIFKNLLLDKKIYWFYYPASFWSHKNHIYILKSLKTLNQNQLKKIGFIFTGSDKGNLEKIKKIAHELNIAKNIFFFKYLSNDQIISIYLGCKALVMPTYLGRSSLPFLEGLFFNKKIFYGKGILDKNFEKYTTTFNLNKPSTLTKLLIKEVNNNKKKNYKNVYNKICDKDKILQSYTTVIEEFKKNRIIH